VSGFLNFDEKIIATTIKLAHAKVSYLVSPAVIAKFLIFYLAFVYLVSILHYLNSRNNHFAFG
jgi:hypothetical protein